MKHRLVRTRESPKNFHDCKELGKNAEARTLFSEKFLELSLRRALAEEPLHANFAQEKSRERAAAPCKEQSKHNQTHPSLSEFPINENRSKTFSENIGQAVIGGDDEAGCGSGKRRKVKQKRHCRSARCRPSTTSCTSRSISTSKTTRITLKITHDECFLILITSGKKCAKATSHLRRIHRRSALQGTAKVQGYALCLSSEAHRVTENISTIALPTSRDADLRLPQPLHNVPIEVNVNTTNRRLLHPRTQKAASRTAKKANAQGG